MEEAKKLSPGYDGINDTIIKLSEDKENLVKQVMKIMIIIIMKVEIIEYLKKTYNIKIDKPKAKTIYKINIIFSIFIIYFS